MAAIPDLPFAFAATCVVPTARPVTTPDDETRATFGSWTLHKTETPLIVFPVASCTVACNGTSAPTASVGVGGVTTIDATASPPVTSVSVELLQDQTTVAAAQISARRTPRERMLIQYT